MVLEPISPAGNDHGLGVTQEAIQDRASHGHGAQKLAPFLEKPVAGHDGRSGVGDPCNFTYSIASSNSGQGAMLFD